MKPKPLFEVFGPLFEDGLTDGEIQVRFESVVDYYVGMRPDLSEMECRGLACQNAGYMAVAMGAKPAFDRLKAVIGGIRHPVFGDTIPESGDAYDIGSEED